MDWKTYSIVTAAVVIVGLALGITLPLVSLRLDQWGYDTFAIGVMASMPAIGVLLGARITGRLAGLLGSERLLRLVMLCSAVSVALLAILPSYPLWLLLRLLLGVSLTITFVIGESWINQLVPDRLRGRLVAVYGSAFAISQLCGPLLLGIIGTEADTGFWLATGLLLLGLFLLLWVAGAPKVDADNASGRGLKGFVRTLPAIAWAVMLFAAFEAMTLTLLPVYLVREGFSQQLALIMISVVVIGDAALQVPIGWLADKVSRTTLFRSCGLVLLGSSLAMPLALHSPLIWPVLVLFGASAGGLYTLSLILVGQRYRDDALVRANAHIALLWGVGCLLGPASTGAASQWLSSHALPMLMAAGALVFIYLAWQRGAFTAVAVEPIDQPG
ncbi:MFS transporter [Halopseudomonas phragmitis]|uniref:MFS transporter n=2 Tax=Pseudomonadaceae TaxID=135621 RepID=A0A1V0B2A7_9GAMM|nr:MULTISPECIES: MFS transporter [Pseudomonadaceae]AQZ94062.1 MFS transporter [Halopseudomonas phragmitis]RHW20828.1 MFS transporter [Pseudomonas jilinensis]